MKAIWQQRCWPAWKGGCHRRLPAGGRAARRRWWPPAGAIRDSYVKGRPIRGIEQAEALPDTLVFQAGTRRAADGRLLTAGGRVLAVTGIGADLGQALERAYAGLAQIRFEGMHFRRDIGAKAQ